MAQMALAGTLVWKMALLGCSQGIGSLVESQSKEVIHRRGMSLSEAMLASFLSVAAGLMGFPCMGEVHRRGMSP